MRGRVLILGGTAEARALAGRLTDAGIPVLSSLAGRVSSPALPAGAVRIGGFGGAEGLANTLRHGGFLAVVDATHPFAAAMHQHGALACSATGVPLLRLARPGWSDHPAAVGWTWVDDTAAAVAAVQSLQGPVFLSTGRQTLPDYLVLADRRVLVRVVEPPQHPLPAGWELIRDRGPYRLESELELLRSRQIAVLVTKDSGGTHTSAKLDAAHRLGAQVVVIRRPPAETAVPAVTDVSTAADWVHGHLADASP